MNELVRLPATSIARRCSSRSFLFLIGLWLSLALGLHGTPALGQNAIVLVGSGSSVPAPLYNRWAQEYDKRNPEIQMRYLPSGTSEGIKQISHGSGDFGAGEIPLTSKEKSEGNLTDLPAVLIGIVPIYNLPDFHGDLRLSGEVLAEIFLGEIKTWNAAQISKLNPGIDLPAQAINVVNRPAGKGSNYVFTDFLSKASSKFRSQVGTSPSPKWPVGVAAERSLDMAEKVKGETGSIGYVELQYALKGNIAQAAVLNSAGKFVKASAQSITAACQAVEAPHWDNFSASLTSAPGASSFPITSFTWIYLRTASEHSPRTAGLGDFLRWMYSDGQKFAAEEGYSELPSPLLAAVKKKLQSYR